MPSLACPCLARACRRASPRFMHMWLCLAHWPRQQGYASKLFLRTTALHHLHHVHCFSMCITGTMLSCTARHLLPIAVLLSPHPYHTHTLLSTVTHPMSCAQASCAMCSTVVTPSLSHAHIAQHSHPPYVTRAGILCHVQYCLMHAPYARIAQKAFSRMVLQDELRCIDGCVRVRACLPALATALHRRAHDCLPALAPAWQGDQFDSPVPVCEGTWVRPAEREVLHACHMSPESNPRGFACAPASRAPCGLGVTRCYKLSLRSCCLLLGSSCEALHVPLTCIPERCALYSLAACCSGALVGLCMWPCIARALWSWCYKVLQAVPPVLLHVVRELMWLHK